MGLGYVLQKKGICSLCDVLDLDCDGGYINLHKTKSYRTKLTNDCVKNDKVRINLVVDFVNINFLVVKLS